MLICFVFWASLPLLRSLPLVKQAHLNRMDRKLCVSPSNFIHGLEDIVDRYDSFIIDQWGVLHNGETPYSHVLECLINLKNSGKKMIMLSNSSKRKQSAIDGMKKVGIDPLLFDEVITSGELGWSMINQRDFSSAHIYRRDLRALSDEDDVMKVFVLGNGSDDLEYVHSCRCILAPAQDADFILCRGTFSILDGKSDKTYKSAKDFMVGCEQSLQECASAGLPMLVTNPDFYRPGCGSPMPGLVGQMYSKLVGDESKVTLIGKPLQMVYESSLKALSAVVGTETVIRRDRVCCIGDSMEHDIKGASGAQMASVFISNGVHASELNRAEGECARPDQDSISFFMLKHREYLPDFVLPCFKW